MNHAGAERLRIAVIGGGTGSYTVLRGLKTYPVDLTAIVSVLDDGGSSGRLRDEFGHLPPGDVRRCLLALAADDEVSQLLRRLFEYRFERGAGLNGHSVGNLLLTALTEIAGDLEGAIRSATRLLNVRGDVIPVTLEESRLRARLADGRSVVGESNIDLRREHPNVPIRSVHLEPAVAVNPRAAAALRRADVIVIGPGDLYTSLMPNLLVDGIPAAVRASQAPVIYVSNLMTKHGETDGYSAADMAEVVRQALGVEVLDAVVASDDSFAPALLHRYAAEHSQPVTPDRARLGRLARHVHCEALAMRADIARHDPELLARALLHTVDALRARRAGPVPLAAC